MDGISTYHETELRLTGVVHIQDERVRFCINIDISKNHLDKYLVLNGNIKEYDGTEFNSYSQTIYREGKYTLYNYNTYLPGIKHTTDPFHISFPSKYSDIIGF